MGTYLPGLLCNEKNEGSHGTEQLAHLADA